MQKHGSMKKVFQVTVSLLLMITVLFSIAYPISIYAEDTKVFGITEQEVEENHELDFQQDVTIKDADRVEPEVAEAETQMPDGQEIVEQDNALSQNEEGETTPQDESLPQGEQNTEDPVSPVNTTRTELPIIFEGGLHYIEDPAYPGERLVLYCMNNQLAWPHSTGAHPNVPNYEQGYLTPEQFDSKDTYDACMQKLRKLLFAGYPYNGERLYKIVQTEELYVPSVHEFNEMLIVPPQLETAFPYLGHHDFTLEDLKNEKHYNELMQFMHDVLHLLPDKSTSNGLTYADITSMPFYKAVNSMTYSGNDVSQEFVLESFANMYSSSYFVTEAQAYEATQLAVWRLLNEYHVEYNDLKVIEHSELAKVLWQYCQHGDLLTEAPDANAVSVKGDLKFTYNPEDGKWHSGKLYVEEPSAYNGLYELKLPDGITAKCENLTYVYGNEEYELISDSQPKNGNKFGIKGHIDWLKDMRQYSPVSNEQFQHMAGAVIRRTSFEQKIVYMAAEVGALEISKTAVGGPDDLQKEYSFMLELPEMKLNGRYGDLEFHDGVAEFTLQHGETKTAKYLPANAKYKITECDHAGYQVDSTNAEGIILKDQTIAASFHNTRLLDLLISKSVEGDLGDRTKPFTFAVQLVDASGKPLQGTYDCVYSEPAGNGQETGGTVTLVDGKVEVQLSHGQQVQLKGIPYQSTYTVTELEANQDGYLTTYNGSDVEASGILETPAEVHVVNTKQYIPETGLSDTGHTSGIMIGLCLTVAGLLLPIIIVGVIRRKKGRSNKG